MQLPLKKIYTASLVLLLVPAAIAIAPKPAQAQLVVTDPGVTVQTTISAGTAAKQLTAPIFWTLAKVAEQAVVKSVVNWINSGFQGSPAFVTDLSNSLQSVADAQANVFLQQLASSGALKSPFQNQVYQAVSQNYFQSTAPNSYFTQSEYTLNQYTSNDSAFLNGATTQGGLFAFLALVMNPQNNPQGATMYAENALLGNIASAQSQLITELNWGQGYLSYRGNCSDQVNSVTPQTVNTQQVQLSQLPAQPTLAPGPSNIPLGADVLGAVNSGASAPTSAVTPGSTYNNTKVTTVNLNTAGNIGNSSGGGASLSGSAPCLGSSIQTPGTAIKAGLDKVLGSGIDTLVSAHDFDEIVNALLGQLMDQVIGPGGLFGTSQPSPSTGGTAYFDQTDPTQTDINSTLNNTFIQTLQSQVSQLQQFQTNWTTINNAAQAAKTALTANSCPINANTLTTTVQPTIDRSAYALSAASYFINQITGIKNAMPSLTNPSATTQLAQISANYTALLATTTPYTLPNSSDISNAATQSADTGTSTSPSLYTQMNQIAQGAAQACTSGTYTGT